MSQVASWAFWGCLQELKAQGAHELSLCRMAGMPDDVFDARWMDWDDAVELFDAAEHLLMDTGMRSAGRRLIGHPTVQAIGASLPNARHPELALHGLAMLLGAVVMPESHWAVHSVTDGACLTGSIPRSMPGTQSAWLIVAGLAERVTTVFGHPPSDVSMRCTDHAATLMVRYPKAIDTEVPTATEVSAVATRLLAFVMEELASTQHDLAVARRQRDAARDGTPPHVEL